MNQEQFNKLFEGISIDNFQDKVLELKDTLSKENDILENSFETIKQKDETITKLQDTNQRLFLRVSTSVNDDTATEETKQLTIDSIIEDI